MSACGGSSSSPTSCRNHLLVDDPTCPAAVARAGRMICERLDMFPVECVVRGYLAGSGLDGVPRDRRGVRHRAAGRAASTARRLPEPIFTPATKADARRARREHLLRRTSSRPSAPRPPSELRDLTLGVYARRRGDRRASAASSSPTPSSSSAAPATGTLVLADEVLTPDSSRFWPADRVAARAAPSRRFDKQSVRDWLTSPASGWDRARQPPPPLPDEVVERTRATYVEAYERLTGGSFA